MTTNMLNSLGLQQFRPTSAQKTNASVAEYWARKVDSREVVQALLSRIKGYRRDLLQTGLAGRMQRSWNAYNGLGPRADRDTSEVLEGGVTGELFDISINHFGSLATQVVTMTTNQKPAVKAIAANSDFDSIAQARFAESLNDYYDTELRVSEREIEATRMMVLLGEGHIGMDWDNALGQPSMVREDNTLIKTGDIRLFTLTPFDIARDTDLQDIESQTWIAFRRKMNRFELAAQYPEKSAEILAASQELSAGGDTDGLDGVGMSGQFDLDFRKRNFSTGEGDVTSTDSVYVWEFRHKPTDALEKGRLIKFITPSVILFDTISEVTELREVVPEVQADMVLNEDGTMPVVVPEYEEVKVLKDFGYPFGNDLFVFSVASERTVGGVSGTTPFFDLLSLQELVDFNAGIIASAIRSGGLQNFFIPKGQSLIKDDIAGGLNVIYYEGGGPAPVAQSLLDIKPEVAKFVEAMISSMRQRVSMNEVTTGDVQRNMPAQAMALLRATSVEFHSSLQASYERLIQRTRTGIIKMLQLFADSERVAEVAGKANQWALKEFKKDTIAGFSRFIVEPVNPALKTLSGKVGFAQMLMEGGMIQEPEQFLQLFSTGRLEPLDRPAADFRARIESDKELLMQGIGLPPFRTGPDGQPLVDPNSGLPLLSDGISTDEKGKKIRYVRPLISDPLWQNIAEYQTVLAAPGARDNPKVVEATLNAMNYCAQLWENQPPYFTMLHQNPKPFPRAPEMTPPPVPPGAKGAPEMPPELRQMMEQMEGKTAGPANGPQVKLPSPPKLKNADPGLESAAQRDSVLGASGNQK